MPVQHRKNVQASDPVLSDASRSFPARVVFLFQRTPLGPYNMLIVVENVVGYHHSAEAGYCVFRWQRKQLSGEVRLKPPVEAIYTKRTILLE